MMKIAIIGAGGFGREVKMLIDQINLKHKQYEFIGFFDDGIEKDSLVNGFPVLGNIDDINTINYDIAIVIAIGNPNTKKNILNKINSKKVVFPTLIHPNVQFDNDGVTIGKGCIICASNIITVNVTIGDFVILNLMCTVGHDVIINDFCSFMPSVNISGEVIIEQGVYIGTGAVIINQLNIGENTIVGAGSLVVKTLPKNCTALGIPAKPIKYHE
ncbi:acetyltransferase [Flavobacterium cellulosilyticum]|uniref:Acetyltransferase n=1 Tax=Flavobacterium cellulosilyticum TaxID=2541731 RepID=A0A4R5CEA2_9FLAO|nr:acetyltransferase [Flavobacterium cellulosilyticum]TDD98388.1 acetyltransferase [Flavobacterium cellulosilyticum]